MSNSADLVTSALDIFGLLLPFLAHVHPAEDELEERQGADRQDRPAGGEGIVSALDELRRPRPRSSEETHAARTPKLRPRRSRAPHMMYFAPVVACQKG